MMNWKNRRVLVTGACGFIGSHLVETLVERGARTAALVLYDARGSNGWVDQLDGSVKDEIEIIQGDIRDTEWMIQHFSHIDVVFHLAALIGIPYSYQSPHAYLQTNVTGTLNVLEAARRSRVSRVINMSTSEVYGTALRVPIDEDHPLQAQSPYAASKIAAEKLAESYFCSFSLPVTTVRAFNTYGPRQSARAVIPTILMQLIQGTDKLRLGDPTTTRDFNYVKDIATGILMLAEQEETVGRTVNIGTGVDTSIQRIAEMAQEQLGLSVPLYRDTKRIRPPKSEVYRLCADNTLLKKLTGWVPTTRLEEGLQHTATWMKKERERYESERYYV